MAQEIELKFIVNHSAVEALRDHLNTLDGEHHDPVQLLNIYYETPDNWLRGHDMGLRIRGENGRYEMTMKVAGRVTGGLHQRPEYNVALSAPTLDLAQLPTEVWPNGELPADLASRVQPLFSTDFYREKWLVEVDGSQIEIALDQGEVKAGEFAEPICELELELLSGDMRAVLKLANQLVSQTGLRQGSLSKAARGYHLAQGNPAREIKPTTILHVAAKADVEQGLEAALELALAQWQYHEELWVRGNDAAKEQVLAAIGLVRHTLMLFGGIVPRKASTHLRDLLTQCEATIASAVSAVTAVYSTETAMAKLALTEWLVSKAWQPFLDAKAQSKMSDSFKRFADIHLSRHAAELKSVFCQPLGDRYRDQLPRLTRDIDSILLLAGYYDPVVAQDWLENWQGCVTLLRPGNALKLNISVMRQTIRNRSGCTAENVNQARIKSLMKPLSSPLQQYWQTVVERLPEPLAEESLSAQAKSVLTFSDFVQDSVIAHPEWLTELESQPPQADEWQHYAAWLQEALSNVSDEAGLMRELRLFRRRIMVRIAWAQTLALVTEESILQQLSHLAETLIVAARDWLYDACCREWGTPCNAQGEAQPLLILGMGKLGGGELNFSSDIDLIFAWPEHGCTQGGRRELDNAQFFTRMGQRLIKVLDQPTQDGFVYRVDMRLRPFGESGPLVLSFAALEDYYQEQGRDWERYAMVKARIMGDSDGVYANELRAMLRPFVFRRYIDFSVIQSLRNMKGMIAREVRRRGLTDNIKLGAGGIREIEFIVQVFQLIRGGREPSLQSRALLPTLSAIAALHLLSENDAEQLRVAYLFLRRLENLLQSINDEQTQTLPSDELTRARLAWAMDFADWPQLTGVLTAHMANVRRVFNELIGDDESETQEESLSEQWRELWQDALQEDDTTPVLAHLSEDERKQVLMLIADFRKELDKRTIGPRGRQVLDHLMPHLLSDVCAREDAAVTLSRITALLVGIVTRTTYLELLSEFPAALKHLISLCAASPMIASQLARYPLLLDELLDPNTLYQPTATDAYRDELRQYLLRVPEDDEEQQLEALRQFKQAQLLRIAAADIAGTLPVMKVSDHLTWLAEAMIDAVVQQAWVQMVARYGKPNHLNEREGRGFAVVGYGKLGGWELGYSSDLDLIFLHDCPMDAMTDGEREIDGRQFYLRLAQRIMHLFSTRTSSGILYEVDARLRPSGAAGMLVTSAEAFADYQKNEAWTWEHQALVRARVVYGDPQLTAHFDAVRREIMTLPREGKTLQTEVREMREKMRAHLGNKHRDRFDIKADEGGITDIEFITQYLVLRYAHEKPKLTRWSDNVRILELLAQNDIMEEQEAMALTRAYTTLRDELHHLALQELPGHVSEDCFTAERELVRASWQKWLVEE